MSMATAWGQLNLMMMFQAADRDRSGRICCGELKRSLSNGTHHPFNEATCRLMIGMFDRNHDGTIDFSEFQSLVQYVNQWTMVFRTFDRDRSNSIDMCELANCLTSFGYRLSPMFYQVLVVMFDRTRRGRLAFDDYIMLCIVLQTFTAAFRDKDTNRNGVINIHYEEFLFMTTFVLLNAVRR